VVGGDALELKADVLMVKYSPNSGGLDSRVRRILEKSGHPNYRPDVGEYIFVPSPSQISSQHVLIVGTVSVFYLDYQAIRNLGHNMLVGLYEAGSTAKHIATTLHGVNTALGNDEVEAFRSLLLGFADAVDENRVPLTLERITFVDRETFRVQLMQEALEKFLRPGSPQAEEAVREAAKDLQQTLSGIQSFDVEYQKPVADETTPHVFVAMPFADDFDDHYYLAIRPAVTNNNLLCVRLDQAESSFTGDIMDQVKRRILSAKLVIALLDNANPNVYLEVGYAWGVGTPTILILHAGQEAPFDVQGARIIYYRLMHKLKDQLTEEIRNLL
jgi:hypothetical protein